MSQDMVDISGLDKAAVLAVLFNGSAPGSMGFLQAGNGPSVMTVEYAQQLIARGGTTEPCAPVIHDGLHYDYLYGRPLKIDIDEDTMNATWYDQVNGGPGTAKRLIEELRRTGEVNSEELSDHRKGLLLDRVAMTKEFVNTPITQEGSTVHLGGQDVAGLVTHHRDQQVERFLQEW
ncbi:MAG TPA: hypothetical protein VG992_04670 [Candidatus Saccharimonadales bacterium]|nr:hypothetical protein [Candidatus Saccharimonadales bacterium]